MKVLFLIFVISSLAAICTGACEPGHQYKIDCNTCTCTTTGEYACTRRACYHGPIFPDTVSARDVRQIEEPVYTKEEVSDSNFRCTPSQSFKIDCNKCWCAADGKRPRFCTKNTCRPVQNKTPKS